MLTIGKLAAAAGVRSDTLRYCEREGLIEPTGKSPAGYRLYDQDSSPPSSDPRQPRGPTDHWTRIPSSSGLAQRPRCCRCCAAQRRCLPSCSARSA